MNKDLILKAIALGMGVAAVVLNLLSAQNMNDSITLLGIGLAALAASAMQK